MWNHPTCDWPDCGHNADMRERGGVWCARHVLTECACGRLMPETEAANGLECDTCDLERFMLYGELEAM